MIPAARAASLEQRGGRDTLAVVLIVQVLRRAV